MTVWAIRFLGTRPAAVWAARPSRWTAREGPGLLGAKLRRLRAATPGRAGKPLPLAEAATQNAQRARAAQGWPTANFFVQPAFRDRRVCGRARDQPARRQMAQQPEAGWAAPVTQPAPRAARAAPRRPSHHCQNAPRKRRCPRPAQARANRPGPDTPGGGAL